MRALRVTPARLPLAIVMIVGLGAAVSWLQGRFHGADVRAAIALAMSFRPSPGGPSCFEAIVARGEGDPRCDGEIVSAWLGDVRVRCATSARPDVHYAFRVLIGGARPPKAESPAARELVAKMGP